MRNDEIKRERTIVEAIVLVLEEAKTEALTSKEIYNGIVERQLYVFGAKQPENIVNGTIRRHCYGIDFPTASPVKYFMLGKKKNRKCTYCLLKKDADIPQKNAKVEHDLTSDERLPEERMKLAYEQHLEHIKKQLLEQIAASDPAFFETLVLKLLLKMGYGYDQNAGIRVGSPHDSGIDGIIYEDKLGLDKIYIQAKRYAQDNPVGRKEVQAFVGAMVDVQKGVFITSSKFTKEAREFADRHQQKHVKLMDGDLLVENMIKYEVGVTVEAVMNTYKIDNDYFAE